MYNQCHLKTVKITVSLSFKFFPSYIYSLNHIDAFTKIKHLHVQGWGDILI